MQPFSKRVYVRFARPLDFHSVSLAEPEYIFLVRSLQKEQYQLLSQNPFERFRLESMLVASIISGTKKFEHITPVLKRLN